MTTPDPTPEGVLLDDARKALVPRVSIRTAAARADMSEGRWRQIVKGFQAAGAGVKVPVIAPSDTIARMAHAVGVTPEQLEAAGRDDAAADLRTLRQGSGGDWSGDIADVPDAVLLAELGRRLADRAQATTGDPAPDSQILRLVARQVDPGDPSTFDQG